MKKIFLLTFLFAGSLFAAAQSLEEANQQLYYERYGSAQATLQQLTSAQPDNAAAWEALVRSFYLDGKADQADALLAKAPASVINQPYFLVARGAVLLHRNSSDSAVMLFNEALKRTREKDPGIMSAIAQAYIYAPAADMTYAIELLGKAIKKAKKAEGFHVLLGDAYRRQLNASEAYKSYQQAIALNDRHAPAYYRIGDIFLSQKNESMYTEYFLKAVQADPKYSPALYRLYVYEFYRDPAKAMVYFNQYRANADLSLQNEYQLADLYYLNNEYDKTISKAESLLKDHGMNSKPALYRLMAYSHAGKKDTAKALSVMEKYFSLEADSNLLAKDFASMAQFLEAVTDDDSLALVNYHKAVEMEEDAARKYDYYRNLAALSGNLKDFGQQAKWLGLYYQGNDKATNLDLFNWALAHFRATEYAEADSIFGIYTEKYPEQSFGFYWQAKARAAMDDDMSQGLAVPSYEKLITILKEDPEDVNYKAWMVESYGYLAAYEVNTNKNYAQAIQYFNEILQVDPDNQSAKKYIDMLDSEVSGAGSN